MEAMEASQHEEGRSIDTRAEFEIEFGIGMHVFECLETHKHCTKQNGRKQPESSLRAMASAQCMERDRQGHARSQQQCGINRRDWKRPHFREFFDSASRAGICPMPGKIRP